MATEVEFKKSVQRDLKKLDRTEGKRVLCTAIEKLAADPECGRPLKGKFRGLRRLRVGDCRVVYARTARGVLVLRIARRPRSYR